MELHNPYNDPNHHPLPPQNPSHRPQAYYPPLQEPYPQPGPQYTYYSTYDPNNNFQYPQQPQNPVYLSRENNLNKLDHGCFQCYKVVLYIILAIAIIAIANIVVVSLQYRVNVGDFTSALLLNLFLAVFIVFQLQAIHQRDLSKAKIALTGFVAYLILFPVYVVGFSLYDIGYIPTDLAIQSAFSILGFAICILFGSIQVYQLLKRNQRNPSDSYQNLNNFTQNPLFA